MLEQTVEPYAISKSGVSVGVVPPSVSSSTSSRPTSEHQYFEIVDATKTTSQTAPADVLPVAPVPAKRKLSSSTATAAAGTDSRLPSERHYQLIPDSAIMTPAAAATATHNASTHESASHNASASDFYDARYVPLPTRKSGTGDVSTSTGLSSSGSELSMTLSPSTISASPGSAHLVLPHMRKQQPVNTEPQKFIFPPPLDTGQSSDDPLGAIIPVDDATVAGNSSQSEAALQLAAAAAAADDNYLYDALKSNMAANGSASSGDGVHKKS